MLISDSLRRMIIHAYTTTNLYMQLANNANIDVSNIHTYDDFQRLPIITKKMIQDNPDAAISNEYKRFPQNTQLTIQRTSGSTGLYLRTYWHLDDTRRSLSELWILRMQRFNIKPTDKYCFFYTTDYVANKIVPEKAETSDPIAHSLGFCKSNQTEESWKATCEKIVAFQPKWMMLQPSTALLLGEKFRVNRISVPESLQYIELTGELLFSNARSEIMDTFKCTVGNQYGCNEANSIAFECQNQTMHIMKSNVFVEILKDGKPVKNGEIGDIHISSLSNYAMPFIRYSIGDVGRLLDNNCLCGYGNYIIEVMAGRTNEFIITSDGNKILPYIFLRPIENINERIGNIVRQFQIIQVDYKEFIVKLVIKTSYWGWRDSISEMFIQYLKEPLLMNVSWTFEFLEEFIDVSDNAKPSYFLSRIRADE